MTGIVTINKKESLTLDKFSYLLWSTQGVRGNKVELIGMFHLLVANRYDLKRFVLVSFILISALLRGIFKIF